MLMESRIQETPMHDETSKLHALVVEDDRMCALIMGEVLRLVGIDATKVASVSEALVALESRSIDLVTLDIRLEGDADGWQLAEMIRKSEKSYASVPIVAVTTCCFLEDLERSRALGIDRHVTKPFHIKPMMRLIKDLLRGRGVES